MTDHDWNFRFQRYQIHLDSESMDIREHVQEVREAMDKQADLVKNPLLSAYPPKAPDLPRSENPKPARSKLTKAEKRAAKVEAFLSLEPSAKEWRGGDAVCEYMHLLVAYKIWRLRDVILPALIHDAEKNLAEVLSQQDELSDESPDFAIRKALLDALVIKAQDMVCDYNEHRALASTILAFFPNCVVSMAAKDRDHEGSEASSTDARDEEGEGDAVGEREADDEGTEGAGDVGE